MNLLIRAYQVLVKELKLLKSLSASMLHIFQLEICSVRRLLTKQIWAF